MTDSHEPTSPATDDADTANTDSPQSPPQSAWVFWGGVTGASLIIALAVAVIISASSTSNSLSAATSGTPNSALSSFTSLKAIAPDINSKSATMLQLAPVQGASIVAPPFFLTDQSGKQMTLAKFAGRPIVLTFNDDRCTDICTLLAQDVAAANRDLGSTAKKIAFVSINTNPYYPTVSDVKTWTDNHGLGDATNWYYGTGSPTQLAQVAAAYKMQIELNTADRTVAHGTGIYFIDPTGHDVALGEFGTDSADTAPFSHALAQGPKTCCR
jgi:cytochrome oxidase Cu insertion factor (SCO1/SenC/PrrC family)